MRQMNAIYDIPVLRYDIKITVRYWIDFALYYVFHSFVMFDDVYQLKTS